MKAGTVSTIPAGLAFADIFAAKLLQQYADKREKLTEILVLLPTHRACRMVRDAFLRQSGGAAILLPRLQAIGDLDEADMGLEWMARPHENPSILTIPPAMPSLQRNLILTRLIQAKNPEQSPDQSLALAEALGTLLDRMHTEGLAMESLRDLVREEGLAQRWQETVQFLDIILQSWPAILSEQGMIDAADRRNRLIAALAQHWTENPPATPVILAGSTGSIPAVRDLIKVIAGLPNGQVVLPGLDTGMDAASWAAVDDTHPQGTLKNLLHHLGLNPSNVPFFDDVFAAPIRTPLIREVMRPATTSGAWRDLAKPDKIAPIAQGLTNLARIDCASAEEEAALIALIFRKIQHQPGKTAALITADRGLARRVAGACARYDLTIDDSAGQFLHTTRIGGFLNFCAATALENFAPVPVLSLLKHRDTALGLAPGDFRKAVRRLDMVLRGPRPAAGMDGLRARAEADPDLDILLQALNVALDPLLQVAATGKAPFATWIRAHIETAEAVARSTEQSGASRLWGGEDGEAAANFLGTLLTHAGMMPDMDGDTYQRVMTQLMRGVQVRTIWGAHPRLSILGPLEARMVNADLVILGGLNEGVWPGAAEEDPWMSRPMRKDVGLPSPERQAGLAAHDFTLGFCATETIITRSTRLGNAPTLPSRWLQRLDTVLAAAGLSLGQTEWLERLRARDHAAHPTPTQRPGPCPPVNIRPKRLSVTEIERLMRDPYGVYARHVLNLQEIDIVDKSIGPADRGTILHTILERFVSAHKERLPDDAYASLIVLGTGILEAEITDVRTRHFWSVRLRNMAEWFISHENGWRTQARPEALEIKGALTLPGSGPGMDFTLIAKADRIDRYIGHAGDSNQRDYIIIDYKSGAIPRKEDILLGLSPQLPLEAGMVQSGAFEGLPPGPVQALSHWDIGGSTSGGKAHDVKDDDIPALANAALNGLADIVRVFQDPATPYYSIPRMAVAPRYNPYAHLARVQEWAVLDDGGDATGESAA